MQPHPKKKSWPLKGPSQALWANYKGKGLSYKTRALQQAAERAIQGIKLFSQD